MDDTTLYYNLMKNPQANNAIGRYNGLNSAQAGSTNPLNFFQKKANSIGNALGTTGAALYESGFNLPKAAIAGLTGGNYTSWHDQQQLKKTEDIRKGGHQAIDDVYRQFGFNGRDDYDNQLYAAEGSGNQAEADRLLNLPGLQKALQDAANGTASAMQKNINEYNDYRANNAASKAINQDQGKFLGSAINTLSTGFDIASTLAGIPNGALVNGLQGGIEGIADELEENGFKDFDWGRAGLNMGAGLASGLATGALNSGLEKRGITNMLGNNPVTQALSRNSLGRTAMGVGNGAIRGALSGAVGGATGAATQSVLTGQDIEQGLMNTLQGAKQGALSGSVVGGSVGGFNSLPGVSNYINRNKDAWDKWTNSGDNFTDRLYNTLDSGEGRVGRWLNGEPSAVLQEAGNLGNRIQDASGANSYDDWNNAARMVADGQKSAYNNPANNFGDYTSALRQFENIDAQLNSSASRTYGDGFEFNDVRGVAVKHLPDNRIVTVKGVPGGENGGRVAVEVTQAGRVGGSPVDYKLFDNYEDAYRFANNAGGETSPLDRWERLDTAEVGTKPVGHHTVNLDEFRVPQENTEGNITYDGEVNGRTADGGWNNNGDRRALYRITKDDYNNELQQIALGRAMQYRTTPTEAEVVAEFKSRHPNYEIVDTVRGRTGRTDDGGWVNTGNRDDVLRLTQDDYNKQLEQIALSKAMQYPNQTITEADVVAEFRRRNPYYEIIDNPAPKTTGEKRTLGNLLKKAGKRVAEDLSNTNLGNRIKDVSNESGNIPERFVGVNPLGQRSEYTLDEIRGLIDEFRNYKAPEALSGNSASEAGEALGPAGDKLVTVYNTMHGGNTDPVYNRADGDNFMRWIDEIGGSRNANVGNVDPELVAMSTMLRDYTDMDGRYANSEHKMLADIADALYNAGVGPEMLLPDAKAVYDKYGPEYFNNVIKRMGEIDDSTYREPTRDLKKFNEGWDQLENDYNARMNGQAQGQNNRDSQQLQGMKWTIGEVKQTALDHIKGVLRDAGINDLDIKGIDVHGSRARGDARDNSDLDVVVEYNGNIREDDLFNLLNDVENKLALDGVDVDINPIRASETGTLPDYMQRSNEYDAEKFVGNSTYEVNKAAAFKAIDDGDYGRAFELMRSGQKPNIDAPDTMGDVYKALSPEQQRAVATKAKDVYKLATAQQEQLDSILADIHKKLGTEFVSAGQKSIESTANKVARKVAEGKDYDVMSMKDHTRGKVMMNSFAEIPQVLSELNNRGINYDVEIMQNPWGYKGYHITFRNPDGIASEIQLTTPTHWPTKLKSDFIYENWRNFDATNATPADRQAYNNAVKESQDLWANVDFKDFDRVANSSSVTGRESWSVEPSTSNEGLTQAPSLKTNGPSVTDNANMSPSSVTQMLSRVGADKSPNINNSPFSDIIAQNRGNIQAGDSQLLQRWTGENGELTDAGKFARAIQRADIVDAYKALAGLGPERITPAMENSFDKVLGNIVNRQGFDSNYDYNGKLNEISQASGVPVDEIVRRYAEPGTDVYRNLMGNEQAEAQPIEQPRTLDDLAQNASARRTGAQNVTSDETAVYDQMNRVSQANDKRRQAYELLLDQYGTLSRRVTQATNPVETVGKMYEMGFEKPAEVRQAVDYITGANGKANILNRKLIALAGQVDSSVGPNGEPMTDFVRNMTELEGIADGTHDKAVIKQIEATLKSLPSYREGSLTGTDDADAVFDVVQKLEEHARQNVGQSGDNYSTTTPEKRAQARVLRSVADVLLDRIYENAPDIRSIVTPEVIAEMKARWPKNERWAKWVDENIATAKTGRDLRAAQRPAVNMSKILDESVKNSGTYGQKTGNLASTAKTILTSNKLGLLVKGGEYLANTDNGRRIRAGRLLKQADKIEGRASSAPTETSAPAGNTTEPERVATPVEKAPLDYEAPVAPYNAIGRYEGQNESRLVENNSAGANTNTGYSSAVAPESLMVYNMMKGNDERNSGGVTTAAQATTANNGLQKTGDYWTDLIGDAMMKAAADGNVEAFGPLFEAYQERLQNNSGSKTTADLSNAQQTQLAKLDAADSAINELETLFEGASGAKGPILGWLQSRAGDLGWDSGARTYNEMSEGLVNQIAQAIGKTDSLNTEGEVRRALQLIPQLTDDATTAKNKLETLRRMLNTTRSSYQSAYGLTS